MDAVLIEKEKIELLTEDESAFRRLLKMIYAVSAVVLLIAAILMINIIKGDFEAEDFLENVVKYNQFAFTYEDIEDSIEDNFEDFEGLKWTERYSTYSDPGNAYKVYVYGYDYGERIEVVTNYEGYVLSVTYKSDTHKASKEEKEEIQDAMMKCLQDIFDAKTDTIYRIDTAYEFKELNAFDIRTMQSDWEIGFAVGRS